MIAPDMATMLAFVATDAAIAAPLLDALLRRAVEESFNRISIDGDTSTNDACTLVATGAGPLPRIEQPGAPAAQRLQDAITSVCIELAQAIVRDGEGATKFVTINVTGGRDLAECRQVGLTVANSPLVKTALFAGDPNWGRILAAVGRCGVAGLDTDYVNLDIDSVPIVRHGARVPDYAEAPVAEVMQRPDFAITIDLGRGGARARFWTCDFSYDYVRINAEYRS
jgi:glutamate N-acetyltransferase/amino-acid N-acetyltransferase